LSDRFRVPETDECPNWTSTGNDRSGEPDRNSWLAVTDRLRCVLGPQLSPYLTFIFDVRLWRKLAGSSRLKTVLETLRTIGKTQLVAVIGQHKLGTKKR
jgi:hypothetical protein